jgi:hypothetical protein
MLKEAEKKQTVHKRGKAGKTGKSKEWCEEWSSLNEEILYFICALIGSRQKCDAKTHLKSIYQSCYTRLLEISANNFSTLWINSNYDLLMHYGNKLPDIVITYLTHWIHVGDAKQLKLGDASKIKVLIMINGIEFLFYRLQKKWQMMMMVLLFRF